MLSWPAEFAGARVETTEQLGSEPTWTSIAVAQAVVDDRWQVAMNTASNQHFFRLVWTNAESPALRTGPN